MAEGAGSCWKRTYYNQALFNEGGACEGWVRVEG